MAINLTYSSINLNKLDSSTIGSKDLKINSSTCNFEFNSDLNAYVCSSAIGASLNENFSTITINFSSDSPIKIYAIRATTASDSKYDVDYGTLLSYNTNLRANVSHSISFSVTKENFPEDGGYRISLYAQGEDNTWDVTYLFMCLSSADGTNLVFCPKDSDGLEVYSAKIIAEA